MTRVAGLLLVLMLAGCQTRPVTRPVPVDVGTVSASSLANSASAAPAKVTAIEDVPESMPSLRCRERADDTLALKQSVIETLIQEGDWYAALAQVDALPNSQPSVALLRADILRELAPAQARRWYDAVLRQCGDVRAEHGLGLLAAREGRSADAVGHLRRVVRAYPVEPRYRNDLGVLYLQLQQDEQAAFELRTAHELAKGDSQPVFNLLLRALVMNNVTEWQQLSLRWAPPEDTRARLADACATLMSVRLNGQRVRCPIDPRRS